MKRGFRAIKGGINITTEPERGCTLQRAIELAKDGRQDLIMGAPILQTLSNEVNPAYDIRTDRFEVAQAAAEKAAEIRVFEKNAKAAKESEPVANSDSVIDASN